MKTSYPGSEDGFRQIVRSTPVPVLIGGGVRTDDETAFLRVIEETIRAGGAGICIGRNLFQRQPVGPIARRIAQMLHPAG